MEKVDLFLFRFKNFSDQKCKQTDTILVAMGNGLWLAHEDLVGFGQLTKTGNQVIWLANKIQPSPRVLEFKRQISCSPNIE